ncbi:MAG TPA: DUF1572 family protein [Vicinamibacterales bacterium]|nr:DUF1572 family protein [Vicinamibacterales bacterium]
MTFADAYLKDIVRTYRNYQALGDKAIAQVKDDPALHVQIDPDSNSIAVIVKHVWGNLRSRFTDFLTTDGEKSDRDRDGEFEMPTPVSREQILTWWAEGFGVVLGALEAMKPDDLERTVYIRKEAFLAVEAINRSVAHTAYHTGQVVYVARHLASGQWRSLSIPKGKSKETFVGDFKIKGIAR